MDLRTTLNDAPQELLCSARGCRRKALWALRWNNPAVHAPERRKVWLACDQHEVTLREFLEMRGFHRDCVPVADLEATDG